MAVRVRRDGRVLCAAMHGREDGDVYLDDGVHYLLSVEQKVLVTEPLAAHALRGEWWWRGLAPPTVEIDEFYRG